MKCSHDLGAPTKTLAALILTAVAGCYSLTLAAVSGGKGSSNKGRGGHGASQSSPMAESGESVDSNGDQLDPDTATGGAAVVARLVASESTPRRVS